MILAHLIGGLGNQMFQYACARRLAHAQQAPLKLDLSAFETYALHRYSLDGLSISAQVAGAREIAAFRRRGAVFRERGFAFDAGVLALRGDLLLEGYWQSERYFSDAADLIRREFRVKAPPDEVNAALAAQIAAVNAVSLHVRRGDYVSNPETNRIHGTGGPAYYQQAAEEIARTESQPHFFLFSDDPAWVREKLQLGFPAVVVERAGPAACQFEDLRLMSLCRHNIIANSSFSWWGAWLNPNPGKKVIAPARWFGAQTHDTRDLVPAGWVRL